MLSLAIRLVLSPFTSLFLYSCRVLVGCSSSCSSARFLCMESKTTSLSSIYDPVKGPKLIRPAVSLPPWATMRKAVPEIARTKTENDKPAETVVDILQSKSKSVIPKPIIKCSNCIKTSKRASQRRR